MIYAEELDERKQANSATFLGRPAGEPASVEDARILIADDDPDVMRLTLHLLQRAGFGHIDTATGGRQAIAMMHARTPDVLLLDVHMPEIDGLATLQAMSADGRPRSVTSVLAVSGDSSPGIRRSMLLHGAEDFLVRPCAGADLVERVKRLATRTRSLNDALDRLSLLDGLVRNPRVARP
jgi:CheY-like chemotaxis protein